MTTSYELATTHNMYHSDVIPLIMNIAAKFNGSIMKFERKGDSHFEMNTVSAAFMELLLEGRNG